MWVHRPATGEAAPTVDRHPPPTGGAVRTLPPPCGGLCKHSGLPATVVGHPGAASASR